jgi:hypothetical protein
MQCLGKNGSAEFRFTMNPTRNLDGLRKLNTKSLWFVVALFCTALFSFPFWTCLYFHTDFTNFANEAMAYRYFFCERVRGGENIVVGVGYLLNMLNQCAYWLTGKMLSSAPMDLRSHINLFAYWTHWIISFLVLIVYVAAALSKRLDGIQKLLVFLAGLIPVFGFGITGFGNAQLPDYARLNMVLAPAVTLLFLINWSSRHETPGWWRLILIPLLLGAFSANKITLAALAPVVMMPLFLASGPSLLSLLTRGIVACLTFFLGFVFVHWLAFLGRISALFDIAPTWVAFVANPGGEADFWSTLFWTQIKANNFGLLSALFPVVFIVTTVLVLRKKPIEVISVASLAVIILAAAFYIYAIFKRPAGSTLLESSQWLFCLTMILLGIVSANPVGRILDLCCVAFVFAVCLITSPYHSFFFAAKKSKHQADVQYAFFQRTLDLAQGRRIVVIFPNNYYHHEGFYELLLKGAVEFPTWRIGEEGMKIIRKYGGNIEFRSEYESIPSIHGAIDSNSILVVFQCPNESSNVKKYVGASRFASLSGISREDWNLNGEELGKVASGKEPGNGISASILYFLPPPRTHVP